MTLEQLTQVVPAFVLVTFRVAGLMLMAPILGGGRVPNRIKFLLAVTGAVGLTSAVGQTVVLPEDPYSLAAGLAGELLFGLSVGLLLSMTFFAAQWAGDTIGQQLGLSMAESFDPTYGGSNGIIGQVYFFLVMVLFMLADGHMEIFRGLADSLRSMPPLAAGISYDIVDVLTAALHSAASVAVRLAAPVFISMLLSDVALGSIGKSFPQLNLMTAGLALRAGLGMLIVILSMSMTSHVLDQSIHHDLEQFGVAVQGMNPTPVEAN